MFSKIIAITVACLFILLALHNALAYPLMWWHEYRLAKETPYSSDNPQLSSTEIGPLLVWEDNRTGNHRIYLNRSTDNGQTWEATDTRLDTDAPPDSNSYSPWIRVERGTPHTYTVHARRSSLDIFFQHSSDYGQTWQTNSTKLDTDAPEPTASLNPQISSAASGHVYAVWEGTRGSGWRDIFFQHSSDYGQTWQTSDTRLDTDAPGAASSNFPQISSDDSGHVYVVWREHRNGQSDIYFNYSSNYGQTWQATDIRLDTDAPGAAVSDLPQISSDETGRVYVVWRERRNGYADIYFNHSSDYGRTWQATDTRLDTDAPGSTISYNPLISSDQSGHVYVLWFDYRYGQDIMFNHSSDYGQTWQATHTRVDTEPGFADSFYPQMSSDSRGYVYAVWVDNRNGLADIYFNFSNDHGVTWQATDIRVDADAPGAADSWLPQITNDGEGNIYFAWVDARNGLPDIYFRRGILIPCDVCDANADGAFDIRDIIVGLKASVAVDPPPAYPQCVDKNADSALNILDQVGCLRKILGLE